MSETRECPYCGGQVLVVAVKCWHCASFIGAGAVAVNDQASQSQEPKKVVGFGAAIVVVAVLVYWLSNNWTQTEALPGRGFTQADIANIRQSIRTEFGKQRGVTVEQVEMVREAPNKLVGFVRVRLPILGEKNKACTATRGDDGQSVWRCQ